MSIVPRVGANGDSIDLNILLRFCLMLNKNCGSLKGAHCGYVRIYILARTESLDFEAKERLFLAFRF